MERLRSLPFSTVLLALAAASMMIPAIHASVTGDNPTARAFFYPSLLFLTFFLLVATATMNWAVRRQGRSHLLSMLAFFAVLPVVLAVPMVEAVPDTSFFNAYTEMVSSLTTTGLTLFEPERLPPSVHLWRAFVGWLGGFFIWVTAVAVLAPLNLGGFEVSSPAEVGQGAVVGTTQIDRIADPSERLRRFSARLLPVYGGLTLLLWTVLILLGENPLTAACHAMSTLATSGISPVGGAAEAGSGVVGEIAIFAFLVFALSRLTFSPDERSDGVRTLVRDPELRFGLAVIAAVTSLLFLRHWIVVFEDPVSVSLADGARAIWGTLFTVTSFITTTGFESQYWESARAWSGFGSPGVLLLGLATVGGGVATTAGGVKLLRLYALYKHGLREMEKLVQPSSIGGSGQIARRFRRHGAYVAWIFFMLFALSIAITVVALSLAGRIDFESAMILAIAALSTTGPLTEIAGDQAVAVSQLTDAAKAILNAAMILGRLETLAIIALLNPDFWR